MPIYEFYCRKCNTIYNFLSRTLQPDKKPMCPLCKRVKLEKQLSLFAHTGRAKEEPSSTSEPDLPLDESKMERAMDALAREAEGMSEEDPRQAAELMRKFSKMTGMELGAGMQEALNRLEAGEEPDQIEAELGGRLEKEDPFIIPEKEKKTSKKGQPRPAPRRDKTLYEM
jgi:putative FmdB family regulatory protein